MYNIKERIEELKLLEDNWYNDGVGVKLNSKDLDWAYEKYLTYLFIFDLQLYPVPENGIIFEWNFKNYDLTLEIIFNNHIGLLHCYNSKTDKTDYYECSINMDEDKNWIKATYLFWFLRK